MRADQDEASIAALVEGLDFDGLLKALAAKRGYEPAFRDPPGRRDWSDVAPGAFGFAELDSRVDRLAGLLTLARPQPGACVAILAPLGPEALISILACLRAGLSPMPLPAHAGEAELLRLIERSGAMMALGVARIGSLRPLMLLREVAARAFGMRFIGGFGADIPDGIAALDQLLGHGAPQPFVAAPVRSTISVVDGRSFAGPFAVAEKEVLAKALEISRALKPLASSRVVTTLVGADLAALATGPGIALLTGVELLPLGLFVLDDLRACLEGGRMVHLVVPGAMEPALARSRLGGHKALSSLVFVRRADEEPAALSIDRPEIAIVDVTVHAASAIEIARRPAG
ncbi:AMP-binding protein [Bosea sp. (in: a-proteobacteria)]|uniref:AMP-binding protein n=1 Tax=Bosea sp. (in: a-proteobacteria) TaxID=1871050 RepID=UPI002FC86060